MEEHIISLSEHTLFTRMPERVEETRGQLEILRKSYGGFYWNLYNGHDGCFKDGSSSCGTMYHLFHNARYADLLETVVLDIYKQIYRYDLSD